VRDFYRLRFFAFFDINFYKFWARRASFVLFFPLSVEVIIFPAMIIAHGKKSKRHMAHKLIFPKPLFDQEVPKKVPWTIFIIF
jgi:hypothetical protein